MNKDRQTVDWLLGTWICDPEMGGVALLEDKAIWGRVCCGFEADGSFLKRIEAIRGHYVVANGFVELHVESIANLVYPKPFPMGIFYLAYSSDHTTLTSKSNQGFEVVYVHVGSERGQKLWESAFRIPQKVSPQELTSLVVDYLNEQLSRTDVRPTSSLGAKGIPVNWEDLADFSGPISKRITQRYGARINPGEMLDLKGCKTVHDFAMLLYSATIDY